MTDNLWSENTPSLFWLCQPDPPEEVWREAIRRAFPVLGLPYQIDEIETALTLTLGEARFGPEHWRLSRAKRQYYMVKPFLSRTLINSIKTLIPILLVMLFHSVGPLRGDTPNFSGR